MYILFINVIFILFLGNVSARVYYNELQVSAVNSTVTVQEDTNVTLSCVFTGYLPIDHQIDWMDNDMDIGTITNGDNTQFRSQSGGSSTGSAIESNYTILLVEVGDSGSYTCSMSGTGLKETITLMVTSPTISCKYDK